MPGSTGGAGTAAADVAALRRLRRRRKLRHVDKWRVVYRIYLLLAVAGVALLLLTGIGGVVRVPVKDLRSARHLGAPLVGLAYSLAIAAAVRSGSRGGPLVLEPADVHFVLQAPVDRRSVLRPAATRALARGAAWGATAGCAAGVVASRAVDGSEAEWILWAGMSAALAGATAVGAGLVGSGVRIGQRSAAAVATALVGWSVLDVMDGRVTSPLSALGAVAVWPLSPHPLDLVAAALAPAAALAALTTVGGLSVEASARRAALAGLVRFSASTFDFRAVALFRRQLAGERVRRRPWFRLPPSESARVSPVLRRDMHGTLRWPLARILRLVGLGMAAGAACVAAWSAAVPIVAVAGVLGWVAALDASEGLGQEVDHPDRLASVPRPAGWVHLRHMRFAAGVLVVPALAGVAVAVVIAGSGVAVLALTTAATAVLCSAAAAAITVLREPAGPGDLAPAGEMAGMAILVRELLPLAVATAGFVPVSMDRLAFLGGRPPLPAALNAAFFVMLAPAAVLGWVHSNGRVPQAARQPDGASS